MAKAALTNIIHSINDKSLTFTLSAPHLDFSTSSPNIVLESGLIGDEASITAYSSLLTEIDRQKGPSPDGYGYVLSADGGKVIEYADFAWTGRNDLEPGLQQDFYDWIVYETELKTMCRLIDLLAEAGWMSE